MRDRRGSGWWQRSGSRTARIPRLIDVASALGVPPGLPLEAGKKLRNKAQGGSRASSGLVGIAGRNSPGESASLGEQTASPWLHGRCRWILIRRDK